MHVAFRQAAVHTARHAKLAACLHQGPAPSGLTHSLAITRSATATLTTSQLVHTGARRHSSTSEAHPTASAPVTATATPASSHTDTDGGRSNGSSNCQEPGPERRQNRRLGTTRPLQDFFTSTAPPHDTSHAAEDVPYLDMDALRGDGRSVFFETYGCQVSTVYALHGMQSNVRQSVEHSNSNGRWRSH